MSETISGKDYKSQKAEATDSTVKTAETEQKALEEEAKRKEALAGDVETGLNNTVKNLEEKNTMLEQRVQKLENENNQLQNRLREKARQNPEAYTSAKTKVEARSIQEVFKSLDQNTQQKIVAEVLREYENNNYPIEFDTKRGYFVPKETMFGNQNEKSAKHQASMANAHFRDMLKQYGPLTTPLQDIWRGVKNVGSAISNGVEKVFGSNDTPSKNTKASPTQQQRAALQKEWKTLFAEYKKEYETEKDPEKRKALRQKFKTEEAKIHAKMRNLYPQKNPATAKSATAAAPAAKPKPQAVPTKKTEPAAAPATQKKGGNESNRHDARFVPWDASWEKVDAKNPPEYAISPTLKAKNAPVEMRTKNNCYIIVQSTPDNSIPKQNIVEEQKETLKKNFTAVQEINVNTTSNTKILAAEKDGMQHIQVIQSSKERTAVYTFVGKDPEEKESFFAALNIQTPNV